MDKISRDLEEFRKVTQVQYRKLIIPWLTSTAGSVQCEAHVWKLSAGKLKSGSDFQTPSNLEYRMNSHPETFQ